MDCNGAVIVLLLLMLFIERFWFVIALVCFSLWRENLDVCPRLAEIEKSKNISSSERFVHLKEIVF